MRVVFQGREWRLSGWQAGLLAVVALGLVAAVAVLGLFLVIGGAVAALAGGAWIALKRRLKGGESGRTIAYAEARAVEPGPVREIVVDEIVVVKDRD